MSREIKFRAFDKTLFKMFEPRTLRDIAKEAPNNGVNWYQFEMMQFTGLIDKNGKDIYEGDRISVDCYWDNSAVEFLGSGWHLAKGDGCIDLDRSGDGIHPKECEVIGHIYE